MLMSLLYQKLWRIKLNSKVIAISILSLSFLSCGVSYTERSYSTAPPYSYVYIPEEENVSNIRNYFREEIYRHVDIQILPSTYAIFNPIGGMADGKYILINYRVFPIDENIFRIELVFRRKKGLFSFVERVSYVFYYDGSIIAFRTIKGKRRFRIRGRAGSLYHFVNVVLPAPKRGKVYLRLKLKAPQRYRYRYGPRKIKPKPLPIRKELQFKYKQNKNKTKLKIKYKEKSKKSRVDIRLRYKD